MAFVIAEATRSANSDRWFAFNWILTIPKQKEMGK